MPYVKKNTSNRSLMFGDFDDDRVRNIDDKYPFNKKKKQQASELMLSEELHKVRNVALKHKNILDPTLEDLRRQGFKVKGRIKGTTSIINKLRRKGIGNIKDLAGGMIIARDTDEIYRALDYLKDNYNVVEIEDFYETPHPSGMSYKVVHTLIEKDGMYMEVQIKTMEDYVQSQKTHTSYKRA